MSSFVNISVGARESSLSRAQVEEVLYELRQFFPYVQFNSVWVKTVGDRDLSTSLKSLDKTDFFTKELDQGLLQKHFRIAIHSAKDLPEPLADGLQIVALTKGVDPSDALVINTEDLPIKARVGTSSVRREQNIKMLRDDLICVDIRGTVESRLQQLDAGLYDAVVIAEAALIRLQLTHRKRIALPGECAPLQGQLAVLAHIDDEEMVELFHCVDTR